ncbi:MAG: hypothetical protein WB992_19310 [Bryobacteraceae bacterium]
MPRKLSMIALLLLPCAVSLYAQQTVPDETGAVTFYSTGGWSFGLPGVQASAYSTGSGLFTSAVQKRLPMYTAA